MSVGTNVVAVKPGKVTAVGQSETFGKYVKYTTEDGYHITYAHLNEVLVKAGEEIEQKQVIAKSGNTGLSTGPHLHYSISKDGALLDPYPFVTMPYTEDVAKEYADRGEKIN